MPRKTLIILCVILSVCATLWIERYPALYYIYLWRINHTTAGPLIMEMGENIESISSHIVPLLVRTYEDVNAPGKSRGAAAQALIIADRNMAETLFMKFLDYKDDDIVLTAIFDLGIAKSDKSFVKIISFAHNPNKDIRLAVAGYLGNFNNSESVTLLKQMSKNDPDEAVRDWATYQLQTLGVIPFK